MKRYQGISLYGRSMKCWTQHWSMASVCEAHAPEKGRRSIYNWALADPISRASFFLFSFFQLKQMLMLQIPLGHMGQAEDIAEVAAFLASSRAKYVNGSIVNVNGGLLWEETEERENEMLHTMRLTNMWQNKAIRLYTQRKGDTLVCKSSFIFYLLQCWLMAEGRDWTHQWIKWYSKPHLLWINW